MKALGRTDYEFLPKYFERAVRLDESKIESGDIYSSELDRGERYSVEMLFLGPRAQVRQHTHENDTEWYFDLNGGNLEFCAIGQSHKLVNAGDKWLLVLSIKKQIE